MEHANLLQLARTHMTSVVTWPSREGDEGAKRVERRFSADAYVRSKSVERANMVVESHFAGKKSLSFLLMQTEGERSLGAARPATDPRSHFPVLRSCSAPTSVSWPCEQLPGRAWGKKRGVTKKTRKRRMSRGRPTAPLDGANRPCERAAHQS